MNRKNFLGTLGALIGATAIAPQILASSNEEKLVGVSEIKSHEDWITDLPIPDFIERISKRQIIIFENGEHRQYLTTIQKLKSVDYESACKELKELGYSHVYKFYQGPPYINVEKFEYYDWRPIWVEGITLNNGKYV